MISDVPADSLFRTERPPTKEIVRYFIRHCALRLGMGESAPWVVEDELVKKFNLPSKFSDFLLDPHKVNALFRSCDPTRLGQTRVRFLTSFLAVNIVFSREPLREAQEFDVA